MDGGSAKSRLKPSPLKINKDSRCIRKPPVHPPPLVQYRQPVIIHTYSPKVIEADASNFRWLVQRLTGSSDTRLRCKNCTPEVIPSFTPTSPTEVVKQWEPKQERKEDSLEIQVMKPEHLLLSPTSSSDESVILNPRGNEGPFALASSPKSPLGLEHSQVFATTSALVSNCEPYIPQQHPQALPWSPIPTPAGNTHDILADFPSIDIWGSDGVKGDLLSPFGFQSRLFSPAAYRDFALAFMKES